MKLDSSGENQEKVGNNTIHIIQRQNKTEKW